MSVAASLSAAPFLWDGGAPGGNNWTDATNWNPDGAPANNGTADITFGGNIDTGVNVDIAQSILSLTFNNTSGNFSISGSALTIGAGGVINNDADMQTINSSVIMSAAQTWAANSGPLTFNSAIQLNANTLLFSAGSGVSAISGSITGAGGGITKTGGGALILSGGGNNTFTGPLTVNAGTVIFNKTPGLRAFAGSLIIGDGAGVDTVQYAANNQSSLPSPIVNSSGVLDLNGFTESYQNITINGGSLTIGGGVLTIGSAVTMTGGSISSTGVGRLVGQGTFTTNAAATSATISGNIDPQGTSHTFNIADGAAAADLDISASVGNGIINKNGAGTLRFSGSVSSGPSAQVIVNSGTVEFAKTGGAFAASVFLGIGDFSGGVNADVVRFFANQQLDAATTISVNSAGLLDLNGFDQTVDHVTLTGGNIATGSGSLIVAGSGIASTISTQTATMSGHLNLSNGARTITVADGTAAPDLDISAAIESSTSAGGIIKTGLGTLRLSGASPNSYGTTTINQGLLVLGKSVTNAIPGDLVIGDGAGLDAVQLQTNDQIADTSNLTIHSSGVLDLLGHSDTINSITFTDGNAGIFTGSGSLGILGSVTAQSGFNTTPISGNLNLTAGFRSFNIADGSPAIDMDITAAISNGTLVKDGDGTLQLSGVNTAQIRLDAGTLLLNNNSALGASPFILAGGTLQTVGARAFNNNVLLLGPTTIGGTSDLTFNGSITGTGALTLYSAGTLTIAPGNTIFGPWTLTAGVLSCNNLFIDAHGSLTMNRPTTFTGSLTNNGAFTYNGGTFLGQLTNQATFNINDNFDASAGLSNFADISIAAGITLSSGGSGISNSGQITLVGGILAGTSPITNTGSITGFGAIGAGPASFINFGLITQGAGTLDLSSTLSQINNGNIDLASGRQLRIFSTPLLNKGALNLNNALISGTQTLNNSTGGTVTGPGAILTSFSNSGGLLLVRGNTNITSPFTSSSIIQLDGVGANLAGGKVTSSGTIHGIGNISSDVDSSGTIEAVGGILSFTGTVNNSGSIGVSTANKVLFSAGLDSNTGIINLTGGTFDNNNRPLSSFGQISGYGTFRASLFVNNGSMTFSGGTTTINGNVTNAAFKQIKVAYNPAIFTGNVINNGTFKNTSTTVTFAGSYTENGTFISDPADNFFSSVSIGENGAWVGGVGDRFFISGDLVGPAVPDKSSWETSQAELHFTGGLRHLLSLLGDDRGVSFDGYDNNLAWGMLTLGTGEQLVLAGEAGSALYVHSLRLSGGVDQISSIAGNGSSLYYDLRDPANAYLNGQTYALAGGGSITPVPEPAFIIACIPILYLARRRRNHAH